MKLQGFIGPAYTLDSVNVDAQRCVNLVPEIIESGKGKGGQVAYYFGTPGLKKILNVGDGPIRLIHRDKKGRIHCVSGNQFYQLSQRDSWTLRLLPSGFPDLAYVVDQSTDINITTNAITISDHGFLTGARIQVESGGTLPTGLSEDTNYFIIKVDDNTIKLASSISNAEAGSEVDISGTGSGFMTINLNPPAISNEVNFSSISVASDTLTYTSHSLYTGIPIRLTTTGIMPSGLLAGTDYYLIKVDDNTLKLAASISDAFSGTAVDIVSISTDEWAAVLLGEDGIDGGPAFTLETSSGAVKAVSIKEYMAAVPGGAEEKSLTDATAFVDGARIYLFYAATNTIPTTGKKNQDLSSLGGSVAPTQIEWVDGFTIYVQPDSDIFYVTAPNNLLVTDSLSFASSEGNPDNIVAVIVNYRDLIFLNEESTEIFANTGNADFPFERVQGGFIQIGCMAEFSVAKIEGFICWLGRSEEGQGIVYAMKGMVPQRISTHAIEQAIRSYADPSSATAYTYQDGGHNYYVINFAEATWTYDFSTRLWHERAYTNEGALERHRAGAHAYIQGLGIHLVGDYANNKVYIMDNDTYSDDGDEITALRSSPHTSSEDNFIFFHEFTLDMETGIGLDGGVQGSNPTVMLDWSNDGGHTWESERRALADVGSGQIGDFKKRVKFRRLGKARDRVWRIKITDPVKRRLIAAYFKAEVGSS